MKILYLCPDLGIPVLGRKGASVHVRELIGGFHRAGHRVTLAAQTLVKTPDDERARVSARVIQIPADAATQETVRALKDFNNRIGVESPLPGELRRICYNDALYRELKRRFFNRRPDFIYERASLYATAGVRLAQKFKVPHIVELNAPLALEQSAYRATGFGELAAAAERWTLQQADLVIVVSAELREHVLRLGVKPARVRVMSNGVNPLLFRPGNRDAALRRRLKLGEGPVLGFVGGLRPWHGVENLPALLLRLSRKCPEAQMVIAGDGQLRGELERSFKKLGLTKRVRFTGALAHEDVPGVIRLLDVALAPYPRHDHDFYFSPLKLFEYMACGVAVVASDVGQIAQVVASGKNGLLCRPGNLAGLAASCEKLLADEPLRARLGMAAARMVHQKFTWDMNAQRVVAAAQKLKRK